MLGQGGRCTRDTFGRCSSYRARLDKALLEGCQVLAGRHLPSVPLQVQGVAPTPSFVQSLGQMSGLRGLDLHHYEGRVGNPLTYILSDALVQHLGHCKHLTWLDISLWSLNEHQVSPTPLSSNGRCAL